MRIELHCHSRCSDGDFAPAEVARRALASKVELFCLTDHDTLAGTEEVREALPGVAVLAGTELSCRYAGKTTHLLAYGIDRASAGGEALEARLEEIQQLRRARIGRIVAKLAELGVQLDQAAILAGTKGRTPGRPDVARALVEAGVCTSFREAFSRFLRDGGPADVKVEGLTLAEGVRLARGAGARCSIAHPHTLGSDALVRAAYGEFKSLGLEGIEAWYGPYARAQRAPWLRVARDLGLVVTGGSDFHGSAYPEVSRPGLEIPDEIAAPLLRWLDLR